MRSSQTSQPPASFEWNQPHGNNPGMRKWKFKDNRWSEENPSGIKVYTNFQKGLLTFVGKPNEKIDGSIVTVDNGSQIFVPNISENNKNGLLILPPNPSVTFNRVLIGDGKNTDGKTQLKIYYASVLLLFRSRIWQFFLY